MSNWLKIKKCRHCSKVPFIFGKNHNVTHSCGALQIDIELKGEKNKSGVMKWDEQYGTKDCFTAIVNEKDIGR